MLAMYIIDTPFVPFYLSVFRNCVIFLYKGKISTFAYNLSVIFCTNVKTFEVVLQIATKKVEKIMQDYYNMFIQKMLRIS